MVASDEDIPFARRGGLEVLGVGEVPVTALCTRPSDGGRFTETFNNQIDFSLFLRQSGFLCAYALDYDVGNITFYFRELT